jgi:hypothetical protein
VASSLLALASWMASLSVQVSHVPDGEGAQHRFVSQIGGQSLVTYPLADLPTAFSSVGLLLQPVAAVLAWMILGEVLGAWQAMGAPSC